MLEVRNVTKTYEDKPLLRGISFSLAAGETLCLLGPSGSGKSTLLRIIAGIEPLETGQVLWEGRDLAGVPVHKRGFGLMFQDYALFPHLNVRENVAFGLRMQNLPRAEIAVRVNAALEQVNLLGLAHRRVTDLSGGEQQRVALARALAPRPRLLMLDEPLGALDRTLREQLLDELRHLLRTTAIPAIYVTHDQEEAFSLADRLLLLHEGRVEQSGSPAEVYACPASVWAAAFLGQTNLLAGRVSALDPLRVDTAAGAFPATPAPGFQPQAGDAVALLFPSDGARLADPDAPEAALRGMVDDLVFRGDGYHLELRLPGGEVFSFRVDRAAQVGERVGLEIPAGRLLALREATG
ncbi:MAG TPA: ABC transporter ATP-binding protein [Anaerolinea sp.]|nr:ABC transporter ATP-binding protein [Anaerolinea sp.]